MRTSPESLHRGAGSIQAVHNDLTANGSNAGRRPCAALWAAARGTANTVRGKRVTDAVHTSTCQVSVNAGGWDGYSRRKPGSGKRGGNPKRFATGCELDDVLVLDGGNPIGWQTDLQRARSSHRCFGTCAPHGARAREVHGLPCRMSDVASLRSATCQSLVGVASASAERLPRSEMPGDAP